MWPIDGERETEPVGPESRLRLGFFMVALSRTGNVEIDRLGASWFLGYFYLCSRMSSIFAMWKRQAGRANIAALFSSFTVYFQSLFDFDKFLVLSENKHNFI